MIVAIDGPAGAGKSTVARKLAELVGFTYLDTGAMYRAVAAVLSERWGASADRHLDEVQAVARKVRLEPCGRVLVDELDVTSMIRTPLVSKVTAHLAQTPLVREALVAQQQRLIASGDWVVDGRDIGTVVAPTAEVKVYLTASVDERATRRAAELGADVDAVRSEVELRDRSDSTRAYGPLRRAEGAVVVDTTGVAVDDVVAQITALLPPAARLPGETNTSR